MSNDIHVFLPCRKGSQRVPRKNICEFAGMNGGLLQIKLAQLQRLESVTSVILSTNDEEIIAFCENNVSDFPKLQIDRRRDELCTSETRTDELIKYVPEIIQDGHVLWTHVTSPFITHTTYQHAIEAYLENLNTEKCDSLMSVTPLQTFIWDETKAINYDRQKEKWPRTQTLPTWYEINSGIFLISRSLMAEKKDRVGDTPYMHEMNMLESMDIDTPEQFDVASKIFKSL